jgi:hypothetical protein
MWGIGCRNGVKRGVEYAAVAASGDFLLKDTPRDGLWRKSGGEEESCVEQVSGDADAANSNPSSPSGYDALSDEQDDGSDGATAVAHDRCCRKARCGDEAVDNHPAGSCIFSRFELSKGGGQARW